MARRKAIVLSLVCAASLGICFLCLRPREEMPPVDVPAEFKLIEKSQAMSTLQLAAHSRHSLYAATANVWFYSGPGDPPSVARAMEVKLANQGRWSRHEEGDSIYFFSREHTGQMIEICPQFHYGIVKGASAITVQGPLQKPGLFERFLAIFPIDRNDPSRFRSRN